VTAVSRRRHILGGTITKIQDKIAALLGCPWSIGMRCHTEDMYVTAVHLKYEQHVEP
jgi:hypothetical protein